MTPPKAYAYLELFEQAHCRRQPRLAQLPAALHAGHQAAWLLQVRIWMACRPLLQACQRQPKQLRQPQRHLCARAVACVCLSNGVHEPLCAHVLCVKSE